MMSLESWKAEFYPVPAEEATGSDAEAIAHSLRKWEGALPENTAKHGVEFKRHGISGNKDGEYLGFNATSCSLCQRHWHDCGTCPVDMETGSACEGTFDDMCEECSDGDDPCSEHSSAFTLSEFTPLPMITLLRKLHADRGGK